MYNPLITAVCSAYKLGKSLHEPVMCTGGQLNQTLHIVTTQGQFIVKILNPAVINQAGERSRYRTRELIAESLKNNISLVSAIKQHDDPLFQFEDMTIMLFPYVHGKILLQSEILSSHTKIIGASLAKIHHANIHINDAPNINVLRPTILNNPERIEFLNKTQHLNLDLQLLIFLYNKYLEHLPLLSKNLVISHRDCDAKNVLWDQYEQYYLIDWESAGLINKTHDVMATAICWSLDEYYKINLNLLKCFLTSYLKRHPIIDQDEIEAGLYGLISDWLGWLDFNLSRILTNPVNSAEYNLGITESKRTMSALPILHKQFTNIINLKM
jgi:Ser/Thr protein kinase RdoA (MazF antagonist)